MSDIRFNQWLHQSGTGGVSQSDGGHVGIGTTNPLIPVGAGNTHILNVGVVTCNNIAAGSSITAGTFYGSGANLTSLPAQATIANNADNRIITGGSGVNLNGEANLTFDGSVLTNTGSTLISNDIKSSDDDFYVYTYKGGSDGQVRAGIQFDGNSQRLRFFTGTNERVRILSGGEFAIGGGGYVGQPFSLQTSSTNLGYMETTSTTRGVMSFRDGNSTQNIGFGCIGNNHVFMKDGNEKIRIDSSGNMTFQNSSTGATADLSSIIFANGNGEVAKIRGETRNGNTNGMITFHTDVSGSSSEKMRINHDGGFCFGTDLSRTAEFSQPDGFSIRFDDKGQFQNSVSNTTGGYMNRKGSDGGILSFAREGTYVGEIGVNSSTIFLNFGGTNAAAHQLDDYEEGTWTPAVAFDVGGGGISYGSRAGSYVKIGRMVHLQYYMVISSGVSSSDYFARLALPFTGIGVQHQDARIRQWNSGNSDWFVSLGGANPVFFKNNSTGGGGTWARGDSVNGVVLSGQYILYV